MKHRPSVGALLAKASTVCAAVSGTIILAVGMCSALEGVLRGVFSRPTVWSVDVSRYAMLWAVFLAAAAAFEDKTHVAVDFIREALGRNRGRGLQRVLAVMGYLFVLIYVVILGWGSYGLFSRAVSEAQLTFGTVQIHAAWLYVAMVLGSVLMTATVVNVVAGLLRGENRYL